MDRSFYEIYLEIELKDSYALRLISERFRDIQRFYSLKIVDEDTQRNILTIEVICPQHCEDVTIQCKRYRRCCDERDSYVDEDGHVITRLGTIEYYADFNIVNEPRCDVLASIFESCNEILKNGKMKDPFGESEKIKRDVYKPNL